MLFLPSGETCIHLSLCEGASFSPVSVLVSLYILLLLKFFLEEKKFLIYSLSFEMLSCDHWKPDGDLVFSAYTRQEFQSFMSLDFSRHLTSEDPVRTQEGGTSNLSLGMVFLLSDASFTHY